MHNDRTVTDEIRRRLSDIESEEGVKIFYACESGSRAWGFPSADSDYDVRFLYIRPRNWYLSVNVEFERDVIERPILDEFDINGWDLRKALGLLRKSNPPLLEWLNSPIIYSQDDALVDMFRALVPKCYSPTACTYHYLQMARGNFREYLKGETVSVKKYFYVLRPIMAIQWIESSSDVVPTDFRTMLRKLIPDGSLKSAIETLIERKKAGDELKREPRIDVISNFIESEMTRFESKLIGTKGESPSFEMLNQAFRDILDRSENGSRIS